MIRRFFIAFAVGFVCMFGATVSYACTSDEIDVLGDGTNCQTTKFTLTTTEIADGGKFQFYISAKGTFYVDCGTGGTLSGTGASGKTITRSNTTGATYTCTYTGNTEAKTIQFGGIAGTAANKPYSTANTVAASVIRFNVTPTLVASVSGSLGAIFPTRDTYIPKFRETFSGCTNLTEIPSTLFSDVTGSATYQFYQTFYGCTNLTEIPSTLFSGVTGAATYMFYGTFYGCTSLESIPDGLFSGISGTAERMFQQTFYNCSKLTGYIPAGMFDKITTYSSYMMSSMFYGTGLDTTCSGTTVQYVTGFESYWSSKVSCTEPFVTPVTLDDQSATTTSVPTTVYLKYGTGWYSDSNATTPISALTSNPTKTDYNFDGYWTATDGAGTQIIDADGNFLTTDVILRLAKIIDASKTIYANWTQDYTVTYDCGDGTGTPPASATATLTKTFTPALNTCSRDGYIFSGWLVSGTSDIKTGGFTWNYPENKTFTAQWIEPKFTITTTEIASGGTFQFSILAYGVFYVDCGDGGTLSGAGVSGGHTITRSNTTGGGTYVCTYTGGAGVKTIRFGGLATGYSAGVQYAAISFANNKSLAGISGTLGAIFPTLNGGATIQDKPGFHNLFYECRKLTSVIPPKLFSGVTSTRENMFYGLFYFTNITGSIPENLFGDISGTPQIDMFAYTFYNCKNLTGSIPENLFSGLRGAPASGMFYHTFDMCSGLTGSIPENLFSGISGAPKLEMFADTFRYCTGLTGSIPENLFSGISGAPDRWMFSGTFSGCSGLTGSIPENLFSGISGAPAQAMFSSTFNGCRGLTGSIPENLFSGISGQPAQTMFSDTFSGCSGLTGSIPENLFSGISGKPANGIFNSTFRGCSGLTGSIPENLFGALSGTITGYGQSHIFDSTFENCTGLTGTIPNRLFGNINGSLYSGGYAFDNTFSGCSGLTGYVPPTLFEGITGTNVSNSMSGIFYGTNLYTTCPCGMTQYITGLEEYWSNKVSCEEGLKDGEFFYNDVCTTDCQSGGTKLMLGNGSEFPILSTKVTNPALNVKFRNNSKVCFVPLESGNGGSGSLNILYGGQTYHAGTLPVEPD